MTNALASAKVHPKLIDYINGHAISAQLNDANECFCAKQVFGEHARRLMISGTKAYYGHLLGASAAIEGIICSLALQHGFVPPTLNYEEPDPDCDLDVVPNQPREKRLHYILSNAFGFGGRVSSGGVLNFPAPSALRKLSSICPVIGNPSAV